MTKNETRHTPRYPVRLHGSTEGHHGHVAEVESQALGGRVHTSRTTIPNGALATATIAAHCAVVRQALARTADWPAWCGRWTDRRCGGAHRGHCCPPSGASIALQVQPSNTEYRTPFSRAHAAKISCTAARSCELSSRGAVSSTCAPGAADICCNSTTTRWGPNGHHPPEPSLLEKAPIFQESETRATAFASSAKENQKQSATAILRGDRKRKTHSSKQRKPQAPARACSTKSGKETNPGRRCRAAGGGEKRHQSARHSRLPPKAPGSHEQPTTSRPSARTRTTPRDRCAAQ